MPGTYNNLVVLKGYVGTDPELIKAGEKEICKFRLSVQRNYKGNKVTDWYNVLSNGNRAQKTHQTVAKGSRVYVAGQLAINEYDSKDKDSNGKAIKRTSIDIWSDDIEVLKRMDSASGTGTSAPASASAPANAPAPPPVSAPPPPAPADAPY
jgi:single-stranded DNA-binding protein